MADLSLGSKICACTHSTHEQTKLIAITGGPGGGKTAVLEMARRSFCNHVAILPEAAGIVFGGGFPRQQTLPGRLAAQRAIYHVQRELEALVVDDGSAAIALCDRGTLDGLAYWPLSPDDYWQQVSSSEKMEFSRYTAVIHMQTPTLKDGYNHDNSLRIESAREAQVLDESIAAAWRTHRRRFVVSSDADFMTKAARALEIIRAELPDCCHQHTLDVA